MPPAGCLHPLHATTLSGAGAGFDAWSAVPRSGKRADIACIDLRAGDPAVAPRGLPSWYLCGRPPPGAGRVDRRRAQAGACRLADMDADAMVANARRMAARIAKVRNAMNTTTPISSQAELDSSTSRRSGQLRTPDGPQKALHALNPPRLAYVAERAQLRDAAVLDVGCGGGCSARPARAGAFIASPASTLRRTCTRPRGCIGLELPSKQPLASRSITARSRSDAWLPRRCRRA